LCHCAGAKEHDAAYKQWNFHAYDHGCLARLPLFMQEKFPFFMTARGALAKTILRTLVADVSSGQTFAHAAHRLLESHKREHLSRLAQYAAVINHRW
jgi:hypothetical protein